ncbi:MAG: (d)CMP kinase [Saprospiraceae bacterium]|nr:(d)CMP kinase [Saprospiraceae bacterium]
MTIAIDGYSSCGKSTLAKALAKELSYVYVDSGAMYRAVTYYFLKHDVAIHSEKEVDLALDKITIDFANIKGKNICFLNNENVENEIRSMRISNNVSEVAAIGKVREKLVKLQRQIARNSSIVMDGRDIGTVVFPNADIKFFVTADKTIRAERRYNELIENGKEVTLREVQQNLEHRDKVDTTRAISPLKKADDAIEIDNTHLNREDQLKLALSYITQFQKHC